MRKITNLAAIVIAVFTFVFTSCTPDPVAPTITVTQETTGEIVQGQKVVFNITVSADAESTLSKFTISKTGTLVDANGEFTAAGDGTLFTFADGATDASFKFEYTIPADAAVGDLELTFTVQDSEALMMDSKKTITVFAAKPTITVTKTSTEVTAPGVAVVYEVVVTSVSSATLKNIAVVGKNTADETIAGSSGTGVDNTNAIFETDTENFVADTKTATFNYTYISPSYALGTDIALTFTVTNSDDYAEIAEQTINVVATPITEYEPKVLTYNSLDLDALSQFNTVKGTKVTSSIANASTDDVVSDFAFCWQNTAGYSIVSPNSAFLVGLYAANPTNPAYSSNTATKIVKITGETFDNVTADYLQKLTVANNGDVKNLVNGDILVFETSAGKKGALKVSIAKTEESITIDVKVQQ